MASERGEKLEQAKQALLDEIIKNASGPRLYVLQLAEAYAWLTNPNNSHGGGGVSES